MRLFQSLVSVLLLTSCACHRASVATYSSHAILTAKQAGGPYELLVRVSKSSERHGKIGEQLIALPRFRLVPGVPVPVPLYAGLRVPGSLPFAVSNGTRSIEEDVNVEVAWEGEQHKVPVCTVTVMLKHEVVSRTSMIMQAIED